MTKARSVLVVLAALSLGVCLAVLADDVPETTYDESESLPYECTQRFSVAAPEPLAEAAALRACGSPLPSAALRLGAYCRGHKTSCSFRISLIILDHAMRC
jgi:hypothetical protein